MFSTGVFLRVLKAPRAWKKDFLLVRIKLKESSKQAVDKM